MAFTYPYPRPLVTVDVFLLRLQEAQLELLLVERNHPPFQGRWALPGGFIEMDEPLQASALRELLEETGISDVPLQQLIVSGDPGRDPRDRTITIVFAGALPPDRSSRVAGGDDASRAEWFSLTDLPELAFDHNRIVRTGFERFRFHLLFSAWWLLFMPRKFSARLLEQVFQAFQLPQRLAPTALESVAEVPILIRSPSGFRIQGDVQQFLSSLPSNQWMAFWLQKLNDTGE